MRVFFVASLALALGACEASADDLLASDLTFREQYSGHDFSIEIDPWLASYPFIARAIRKESLQSKTDAECYGSAPCFDAITWEMHYGGHRLVSLTNQRSSFHGGAHPSMTAADRIYDVETGEVVRFGDLFNSWPAARAILQRDWCRQMSDHSTCPDLNEQALALAGGTEGANSIYVQTSDYAFGSYAEGPDRAYLTVTPELIALAKPEYQSSFVLAEPCC